MNKKTYVNPETELIFVKFEENILSVGDGGQGEAGGLEQGKEYMIG